MGGIHILRSLIHFSFGRRRSSWKVVALVPGLVALVFVGHAYEDDGLIGGTPYLAIIVLSASYVLRPMLVAWGLLFGAFVLYTALIVAVFDNGPRDEWLFFMLLGLVPALLLWLARPRELQTNRKAETTVVHESKREPDTGSN